MCGIVSLIARKSMGFYHKDMEILEALLVLDGHFRGLDSTGAFQVLRNRQVHGVKQASHPYHLFSTDMWPKFTQRAIQTGRVIVGHNRKATQGAINSENAHPFNEGKITLVHNGTLREHKKMAEVDVDSHAVCHALNSQPALDVLKEVNGAFAFVWWDSEKDRLFAIRNEERPLHLVTTDDMYILISEPWMASAILGKHQKKIESIVQLKAGVLHEFDLDGNFTADEVEIRKAPVYSNNHYYGGGVNSNQGNVGTAVTRVTGTAATSHSTTTRTGSQGPARSNVLELPFSPPTNVVRLTSKKVDEYKVNELVMCKVVSITWDGAKSRNRILGVTMEPGLPQVDFIGYSDGGLSKEEKQDYMNDYVLGRIDRIDKHLSCGPVIHMKQFVLDYSMVTHNGKLFGSCELAWVLDNCKCSKCSKELTDEEAEFTSIVRQGLGTEAKYKVTCPDCVQEGLLKSNKELHDEFEQRRLTALENGQSSSKKSPGGIILEAPKNGTPTVH